MTRKGFLFIAIATFLTVVLWVVFGFLHSRANTLISEEEQQIIQPVNPNFDLGALK